MTKETLHQRSASKKRKPSAINTDRLKTTLIVGGLLATYLGADLLASADTTSAKPAPQHVAQIIKISSSTTADGFTLQLDPISDVVSADQIPKTVTKSRSSK